MTYPGTGHGRVEQSSGLLLDHVQQLYEVCFSDPTPTIFVVLGALQTRIAASLSVTRQVSKGVEEGDQFVTASF
jgi:hypothetical protein